MKKKIVLIAVAVCVILAGVIFGAYRIVDGIRRDDVQDSRVSDVEDVLDDMRATEAALNSGIADLTDKVGALETELETAKSNLGSVSSALEKEIADRKEDIATLKSLSSVLSRQISSLESAIRTKTDDVKDWASETFATLADWNAFKAELNDTITALTDRINTLDESVGKINSTLDDM